MDPKLKFSKEGLGFLFCTFVAFVLLLCFMVKEENPDCVTGYGCYYGEMEKQNRKLLSGKKMVKGRLNASSSAAARASIKEISELRMAPSGPDPLHHNANPKKPRTP